MLFRSPLPQTTPAGRLLISSLGENRRGTMLRNPTPPTPRLPAGQVRSPVSFFRNSAQVPVDLAAHIRYTGLALVSHSQTKPKAKRAAGQPFSGAPCRSFFLDLFCNRPSRSEPRFRSNFPLSARALRAHLPSVCIKTEIHAPGFYGNCGSPQFPI